MNKKYLQNNLAINTIIRDMVIFLITFGAALVTIQTWIGLKSINYYYGLIGILFLVYSLSQCNTIWKNIVIFGISISFIYQIILINSNRPYEYNYNIFIQFYSLILIILCTLNKNFIISIKEYIIKRKKIVFVIYSFIIMYYLFLFFTKKGFCMVWGKNYFQAFYWFPHQASYILIYVQIIFVLLYKVYSKRKYKTIIFIFILISLLINLFTGARVSIAMALVIFIYFIKKAFKKRYLSNIFIGIILIECILINLNYNIIEFDNFSIVQKFEYSLKQDGSILGSRMYIWENFIYEISNNFTIKNKILGLGFGFSNYVNIYYGNGDIWSHNDFLEAFLSGGLIDLSIYIGLFISIIIRYKNYFIIMLLLFLAYFNGFFSYLILSQGFPIFLLINEEVWIHDSEEIGDRV